MATTTTVRKENVDGLYVIYESTPSPLEHLDYYKNIFEDQRQKGILDGSFDDNHWIGYNGVRRFGIDFEFDRFKYSAHGKPLLNIPYKDLITMLKCFALSTMGTYCMLGLVRNEVQVIEAFFESYGDPAWRVRPDSRSMILDFMVFAHIDSTTVELAEKSICVKKVPKSRQRVLCPMINYLVLDNELTDVFRDPNISNEDFIQWFPLYFWCKVTFVIPLRATETLVTPYDCISVKTVGKSRKEFWISVRRTKLKKQNQDKIVSYNVEKDYKICSYRIFTREDGSTPELIQNIEKYKDITQYGPRKYLLTNPGGLNEVFQGPAFNLRIASFFKKYLFSTHKYDLCLYATGQKKFQIPTMGDSRPIAMTNIFYQGNSAEVCRQLADQENIEISDFYSQNISRTVEASSIMRRQKKINAKIIAIKKSEKAMKDAKFPDPVHQKCLSPNRPFLTGNVEDCIKEHRLGLDCVGCRYFNPDAKELQAEMQKRKDQLAADVQELSRYVCQHASTQEMAKMQIDTQTAFAQLYELSEVNAKKKEKEWEEHRPTQTNN